MGGTQTANERSALRPAFAGVRAARSLLEIEAWMPSEIKTISPLVDRLMRLIEGSRCVAGNEPAVELALREGLSNAVVHGNGMDAHKFVQVRCQCELGKGVSIIVTDHGQGFDPKAGSGAQPKNRFARQQRNRVPRLFGPHSAWHCPCGYPGACA